MLLSAGVYWTIWGWKFALGVVLSIYVLRTRDGPRPGAAALRHQGHGPDVHPGCGRGGPAEAVSRRPTRGRARRTRGPDLGPGRRSGGLRCVPRDGERDLARHRALRRLGE